MRGGYLYVPAYDKRGVYKINVANITDVTLIPLGFMSGFESIGDSGSMDVCMTLISGASSLWMRWHCIPVRGVMGRLEAVQEGDPGKPADLPGAVEAGRQVDLPEAVDPVEAPGVRLWDPGKPVIVLVVLQ